MSISHNRRLATTMEGYVGHVPRETKPGDAIYVLPGCKVPVVVRKMGGQWGLLGECYVHGFMNGEAFGIGRDITRIDLVWQVMEYSEDEE
jgi:hypothetical protein